MTNLDLRPVICKKPWENFKFLETHEIPKVLDTETDSSSDSSFVEVSEINNMNRGKSGKGHGFESHKYHFFGMRRSWVRTW